MFERAPPKVDYKPQIYFFFNKSVYIYNVNNFYFLANSKKHQKIGQNSDKSMHIFKEFSALDKSA